MEYLARVNIMGGGSWQKADTKMEAVRGCIQRVREDWSHLFDIDAALEAGELKVNLYKDGGTDSFEDDEFIETVTAIKI